jgi:acyl-CoA thioester hydrolase
VPRIFHKTLSVGPESIDAVGHVNNREYLRWMEEIAVEHSTAQGWPMERYFAQRMAWVAISHYIEYLRHLGCKLESARLDASLRSAARTQAARTR